MSKRLCIRPIMGVSIRLKFYPSVISSTSRQFGTQLRNQRCLLRASTWTIPLSISGKNYYFSLELNLHVGPRIDHLSVHEAFHLYRIAHNFMSSTEQGLDVQPQIRHTTHTPMLQGRPKFLVCIHMAPPVLSAWTWSLFASPHSRTSSCLIPPSCGQGWCRSLVTSPDPRYIVPISALDILLRSRQVSDVFLFHHVLSVIDQRLAVSHQPIVTIHHALSWEENFPTSSSQ